MRRGQIVEGRFEILKEITAGGMGRIFQALDQRTGAHVAVKVVARAELSERFLRESTVLSQIVHPGIVRYIAHGATGGGEYFLAMEWLEGEDLQQRLDRLRNEVGPVLDVGSTLTIQPRPSLNTHSETAQIAPIPEDCISPSIAMTFGLGSDAAVLLARRATSALAELHRRGVIHRDIKPSNLFLPQMRIDLIKLLDLGTARLTSEVHDLTDTGVTIGTPRYMAPEQASGNRRVGTQCDIWSLGCVLYEVLALQPPFTGPSLGVVLAQILTAPPPPLERLRPDIPKELVSLIYSLLAKDPQARPADGDALLAELAKMPEREVNEDQTQGRTAQQRMHRLKVTTAEMRVQSALVFAIPAATDAALQAEIDQESHRRGGRLERIQESLFALTLPGRQVPVEAASRLARIGLVLRARMPNLAMALVTTRYLMEENSVPPYVAKEALTQIPDANSYGIYADELTASLLDTRFEFESAVQSRLLLGEREAVAQRTLLGKATQLWGRQNELRALQDLLGQCKREKASRAILLTALAGMGKSRLREEFVQLIRQDKDEVEVWLGQGDAVSAGSPFALLGSAVRRAIGLLEGEPLSEQWRKLRKRVAKVLPQAERSRVTAFLGELLGARFPDDMDTALAAARREPRLMADSIAAAWERWLEAESARKPILLVLEDLHWGDLPTVRLIDGALSRLPRSPFLVLALARPEVHALFPQIWSTHRVQEMRLDVLPKAACEQLVRGVLGSSVDTGVVQRVIEHSGGNAFYLEELVRAVASGEEEEWPKTALGMLQARLDGLGPEAKRVLQVASVLGEVFWLGSVRALLGEQAGAFAISDWLDHLINQEVIVRRGSVRIPGEVEYKYRHSLVRDAAYAMLSDADRKLAHRLAGEWLEGVGERDALVLAEHFRRGQELDKAILYYQQAAQQAMDGNDLQGAIDRAEKARAAGASKERLGQLLAIQATAAYWQSRYLETHRYGMEALLLLPRGSAPWFQVIGHIVIACARRGELAELSHCHEEMLVIEPAPDAEAEQIICLSRLIYQWLMLNHIKQAEALLQRLRGILNGRTIENPLVRAQYEYVHCTLTMLKGDLGQSAIHFETALAAFQEAGDLRNLLIERSALACLYGQLGLVEQGEELCRQNLAQCERHKVEQAVAFAKMMLGGILAKQPDKYDEANRLLRDALSYYLGASHLRWQALCQLYLAMIAHGSGDNSEAIQKAGAAAELSKMNPMLRIPALSALASALSTAGRAEEAVLVAREAVSLLESVGTAFCNETAVPMALSSALHQAGAQSEALHYLFETRQRILYRASRIPRPDWRERFLAIAEHAHILARFSPSSIHPPGLR